MRFYNKKQNIFLTLTLVFEFFFTSTLSVSAFPGPPGPGPGLPSASDILNQILEQLHVGKGTLQDIGEELNTSGSKGNVPEVSLFFTPTDPKAGTKLSVKAFPIYFSVDEKDLYYTWYLKRKDCDLKAPLTDANRLCDANKDGEITVEDWKIEAAKILVQSGYDNTDANYDNSPTDDNDGYKAKFGGEGKEKTVKNYCYASDATTGLSYEIVKDVVAPFDCSLSYPSNKYLLCADQGSVSGLEIDPITGKSTVDPITGSPTGNSSYDTGGDYAESGKPSCSEGALTCGTGNPYCSSSLTNLTTTGPTITMISVSGRECTSPGPAESRCSHLFPLSYKESATGTVSPNTDKVGETGGQFGADEERFWGTNPEDPSTADNGNKDEANVVGLGQSSFTWNYDGGDKVGVAVEGFSMNPTKHDNSSYMVMWAFPKKNCSVETLQKEDPSGNMEVGSYTESIKGFDVTIPAVSHLDLNRCIAWFGKKATDPNETPEKEHDNNLVDPTEGGQATKLSVSVTASPENPINDTSDDKSGDTVVVQATVDNAAQSIANISFDWKVSIGNSIASFSNGGGAVDITDDLRKLGLLGNIKGNALDTIRLKLDIKNDQLFANAPLDKKTFSKYLAGDMGYLKFKVATQESFDGVGKRKGSSDDGVIVKFVSSGDKISVHKVNAIVLPVGTNVLPVGTNETTKVSLDTIKICDLPTQQSPTDAEKAAARLDQTLCRVIKNQIIGLKVDGTGLSNFNWTINGAPLVCTARVSEGCSLYVEEKSAINASTLSFEEKTLRIAALSEGDKKVDATAQGDTNFFPVSGNPGDTYTITMTANNVTSGKTVTLTRSFNVVEPRVVLKPTDTNAWQKYLGQYKDLSGTSTCQGSTGHCDDLSESMYQTYSGSDLEFYADFIPDYIGKTAKQEWTVDGVAFTPSPWSLSSQSPPEQKISILADKPAGGIYSVNLLAQYVQPDPVRKALLDIWGITGFDSPEINFGSTIQVEVEEVLTTQGPLSGPRKYYAAIASYIPASILFTFRIFLSVVLTLFALHFLYALLEERRIEAFVRNFSRSREK